MQSVSRILDFLANSEASGPLIIAPNAPPVHKSGSKVQVALDCVLRPEDVSAVLLSLRRIRLMTKLDSTSSLAEMVGGLGGKGTEWVAEMKSVPDSETFSFGILNVGRFRVKTLTQRGSKILSIERIPFDIPAVEDITEDLPAVERIRKLLTAKEGCVLTVSGPGALANSLFLYSALKAVNDATRRVMFIVERSLTFLMNHNNSIVIQSEVGSDVCTFEEGLLNAFPFKPDIVWLGDIWPTDDVVSLRSMARPGVACVLSSNTLGSERLFRKFWPSANDWRSMPGKLEWYSLEVTPGPGIKVSLALSDARAVE